MDAHEDKRIGGQEEIEQAVDESHVDREQSHDGLQKEQPHGAGEVLLDEFPEVDLDLLLLGVDTPVQGAAAQLGSLLDKDDGRIRLVHEQQIETEREPTHKGGNVHGPAPAKVRLDDKTTDEGSQERAGENGHGEERDSDTSSPVVEHVGEDGTDDGERGGAHKTGEETTDEECLQVLGYGTRDAEDGEAEHGDDERQTTSFQLGQGRPEDGTRRKSEDEE